MDMHKRWCRWYGIWISTLFLLLPCGVWAEEPDPEEYLPEHVEVREVFPAGVLDEWWSRVSRTLILHVTPAHQFLPNPAIHHPWEIIRVRDSGFWIRNATLPKWEPWPPVHAGLVFSATTINATTINSTILNATTIFADAVITEPTAMWFDGDHSLRTIYLREPAYEGTLKITAITSPRISHLVELQKDNHYVEITQPGLLGARAHIIAVSPMEKWWKRVKFKFEYVPVR